MYMFLLLGILFFVLTPGVFVTFPSKSSKMVVAATHAAIFVIVLHILHMYIHEGFQSGSGSGSGFRQPQKPEPTRPQPVMTPPPMKQMAGSGPLRGSGPARSF